MVSALLLMSVFCAGAQWVVSQDGAGTYRTIKAAMDAARFGDTIYVHPGTYEEQVLLKNGVTLLGSGVASTTVRYGYGFDPTLVADHVSSGRVEGFSFERVTSLLDAPVARLNEASVAVVRCAFAGGRGSGVEITGSTSRPSFEDVVIRDNAGHGVWARAGTSVRFVGGELRDNAASGLVADAAIQIDMDDVLVTGNDQNGLVFDAVQVVHLDHIVVRDNGGWGIRGLGATQIHASDSVVASTSAGGVLIESDGDLTAHHVQVDGGEYGVLARDHASVSLSDSTVRFAASDGIRFADNAGGHVSNTEIVSSGRHGVIIDTSMSVTIVHCTLVRNAGDAVQVLGPDVEVTHCIMAYNNGAGLRVSTAPSAVVRHTFGFNDFWSNTPNVRGVTQRPSDLVEAPEFSNLEKLDLALRPGSPCIGAGSHWSTLGASPDPSFSSGIDASLAPVIHLAALGADVYLEGRFSDAESILQALDVGLEAGPTWARVAARASLLGAGGRWIRAEITGSMEWPFDPAHTTTASFAYEADAVLDGSQTWYTAALGGSLRFGQLSTTARIRFKGPGALWSAHGSVSLDLEPLGAIVSLSMAEGILKALQIQAQLGIPIADGQLVARASSRLIPGLQWSGDIEWARSGTAWRGGFALEPTGAGAWRVDASVDDQDASIRGQLQMEGRQFVRGRLGLSLRSGAMLIEPAFTLLRDGGVGASLALTLRIDQWLRPAPNLIPVPAFSYQPEDPEVGDLVRFSAAAASDPDGQIVDVWWDFGGDDVTLGLQAQHAFSEPGVHPVSVRVIDDDGAVATLEATIQVWPADSAPAATFVATPVSGDGIRLPRPLRQGDHVLLDASDSTDSDGHIEEYGWDIDSDGRFDFVSADPVMTIAPLAPGSHPVTLRVVDDTGRSDAAMRVLLVDRFEPPHAAFDFTPPSPAILDPVFFADDSSDADGKIVAWAWDFGDGRSSRERNPAHRYADPGLFAVTLTVTDDDGLTGVLRRDIHVVPIPELVPVGDIWALSIGISDYDHVKDLQFGRQDAASFCTFLLDAGVPAEHVQLLTDRDAGAGIVSGVASHRATLVAVREALGWLRRVARPDDLVLIQFSGHGFQGEDDDGDERDGLDEFFVLVDTVLGAEEDTALRDDEFGRFLDRIDSRHVLVFFDGCYSGGLSRSLPGTARATGEEEDPFQDLALEGRLIFSAAGESQEAYESPELGHGIFTYYVIEGLRGNGDQNGDGRVTAWELFEYLSATVPPRALQERGKVQEPQLIGEGDVRVLLSAQAPGPDPQYIYTPSAPYAGGKVRFVDQSAEAQPLSRFEWQFGDGASADGRQTDHVYEKPGEYTVRFTITDAEGHSATTTSPLFVAPRGTVTAVEGETIIISLGESNGLVGGMRFLTVPPAGSGLAETLLEVIETLSVDAASCRRIEGPRPDIGAALMPIPGN